MGASSLLWWFGETKTPELLVGLAPLAAGLLFITSIVYGVFAFIDQRAKRPKAAIGELEKSDISVWEAFQRMADPNEPIKFMCDHRRRNRIVQSPNK